MPWRRSVAARPADGVPALNSSCTESRARIAPGGLSGIASRTAHGDDARAWIGSSRVRPQSWDANGAIIVTNGFHMERAMKNFRDAARQQGARIEFRSAFA